MPDKSHDRLDILVLWLLIGCYWCFERADWLLFVWQWNVDLLHNFN